MNDEPPPIGKMFLVGLAALVMLALLFLAVKASAHDVMRPDLDAWFTQLKSRKGLCCDGKEALHLSNVEWQTQDKQDSHFRVKVPVNSLEYDRARNGQAVDTTWIDVPDEAVIEEPNKAGSALVWPVYSAPAIWIRCFMPGAET